MARARSRPTFSAGLTAYDITEPLDVCIERADRALYKAKASGRNCTVIRQVDSETGKETSAHAPKETQPAQLDGATPAQTGPQNLQQV